MTLSIPTLQMTDGIVFLTCGTVFVCCWLLRPEKLHFLLFGASFLVCATMAVWFTDFGYYGSVWSPLGWSAAGSLFWIGLRLCDGRSPITPLMTVLTAAPTLVHIALQTSGHDAVAINQGSTLAYAVHEAAVAFYVLAAPAGSPIRRVIGLSLAAIAISICLPLLPMNGDLSIVIIFLVDHVSSILLTTAILALEAEKAFATVERQAHHDPLTGALNRAGLLLQTGKRFDVFGVVVVDLDHFKSINDRFGHAAGDHVLQKFVRRATAMLPDEAYLARFGGEEFVIVLPCASRNMTLLFAERLRHAIGRRAVEWRDEAIVVTVSVGVSTASGGADMAAAIGQADKALYDAKANGRNQVRAA